MCCMASSNNTKFITALTSLYDSKASSSILVNEVHAVTGKYLGSPTPAAKWQ